MKIKPISKPKKESLKSLEKNADRLYQEVGRSLYNKCLICGGEYSCLHHFFPKSTSSALSYDIDNGIPICVKCHCRIHSSDDPTNNIIIISAKGEKWLKDLISKRHRTVKKNKRYLEEVIEELNFKL